MTGPRILAFGRAATRKGYTLLEVLLAMAISVMLLGALYVAVDNQLRLAKAGREVVEQATLARALLARLQNDIASSANLCDPARYRVLNSANSLSGNTTSSGSTGTSGSSASANSSTPSASSGASANTGSAPTSAASSAGSTGSSSTSSSSSTANTTGSNVITLPLGVQGDANTMNLFVTKVPREVWGTQDGDTPIVSDLRRISYWLAGSGDTQGLARQEIKVATSQDAANLPPGIDNETSYIIADEVRSVSFSYFDGTNWNDSWDSTQLGADGVTPIGPPRAIAITLGIPRPGTSQTGGGERAIKSYRHVVAILSANGTTLSNNTGNNPGTGTTMP